MTKLQEFPEQSSETDIAAVIASRICHDLISPLGAIGNGVELLSLGKPLGESPELALIAASVEQAQARVRFFRIAFGEFSAQQLMKPAETRSILASLFREMRLSVTWEIDAPRPRQEVKLAFLLIQCLETTMPWGGDITIRPLGAGWIITGQAGRMQINRDMWDCIAHGAQPCTTAPQVVQFALASAQCRKMSCAAQVTIMETVISFGYTPL